MEIILLESLGRVGKAGDIVSVKDGYARNYLFPQRKALRATKENKDFVEQKRAEIEAKNQEQRQAAEKTAAKIENQLITIICQAGEDGRLFGSVRSKEITDAFAEKGFKIDRSQVNAAALKELGVHPVKLALHAEVIATVYVNIARSEAEGADAAAQFKAAQSKATAKEKADANQENAA